MNNFCIFLHFFIRDTYMHSRTSSSPSYTSLVYTVRTPDSANEASAKCALSPRRSDFCRVRFGLPLNRLNERGRVSRLCLSAFRARDADYGRIRARTPIFLPFGPPFGFAVVVVVGWELFHRDDLVGVSFRAIKELSHSSGNPTVFAV